MYQRDDLSSMETASGRCSFTGVARKLNCHPQSRRCRPFRLQQARKESFPRVKKRDEIRICSSRLLNIFFEGAGSKKGAWKCKNIYILGWILIFRWWQKIAEVFSYEFYMVVLFIMKLKYRFIVTVSLKEVSDLISLLSGLVVLQQITMISGEILWKKVSILI